MSSSECTGQGSDKKKRAPNFSSNERGLLLNIIADFKNIIENKKTDGVTWQLKDETWGKITRIFNSQSTENVSRTKDSLRKFYENLKKNIRKDVAQQKKAISCTGGGPPPPKKTKIEDHKDLLLSLVNEKTVYGLNNPYDGDCPSTFQDNNNVYTTDMASDSSGLLALCDQENKILNKEHYLEHSYATNEATNVVVLDIPAETANFEERKAEPQTPSNILKSKKDNTLKNQWTSRRTPNISSQSKDDALKDEYSELAKIKIDLYKRELELAVQRNEREKELYEITKETLLLELKKKKLELKSLEDIS